jgi:predicted GNAT superfamily acetyltransferase
MFAGPASGTVALVRPTTPASSTATVPPSAGAGDGHVWAAAAAAARAGVEIRDLNRPDEAHAAAGLLSSIWRTTREEAPVPADVLRALAHAGNYVAGAYSGAGLVGVSAGFFSDGEHRGLHSHVSGVRGDWQGRSVGFALKQHQRAWALARGTTVVTWTFDPLVRRNAYFNLVKLGAAAVAYLPGFYGPMTDGINAGDDSDRLLVRWDLDSEPAARASVGLRPDPALSDTRVDDPQSWLLSEDADGSPVRHPAAGDLVLCRIPSDIAGLRGTATDLARAWRRSVRDAMEDALGRGYRITGMTRDGWYVLQKSSYGGA